jgi:hypothetical protein
MESSGDAAGAMSKLDWGHFLANQEIVVATRFSFLGRSGWQGAASKDRDLLFSRERLLLRLSFFQSIALPSLAAQCDRNFHLYVLTSRFLPLWAKEALRDSCLEFLPESRFTIEAKRPGIAASHYRKFLRVRYGTSRTLQIVLDDDDGIATDFLSKLRVDMGTLEPPESIEAVRFVSNAHGYGLDVRELETSRIELFPLHSAFINLGLAVSAEAGGVNIFGIAHQRTPRLYPHIVKSNKRMWTRTIHVKNDSRARIQENWAPVHDWRRRQNIAERFPWLLKL